MRSMSILEEMLEIFMYNSHISSSRGLHLIVVRRFEYADDPKSYTSGSLATGRASHAGKVEG
jgi:hypothetical protein